MKRNCIPMRLPKNGRAIYIDEINCKEICDYIGQDKRHKSKFQDIVNIIMSGLRNTELYDKEEIDGKSKGVTAMKFFKGQENDRIYCKEVNSEGGCFVVVVGILHLKKKSRSLTHKEREIIKTIGNYEYEIR